MSGTPAPAAEGEALLRAGLHKEAVRAFTLAMQQQPAAPEPRVGLSEAFEKLGDPWTAAAWLSDACRVAPARAELWLRLAGLLARQRRDAELEPLLAAACALHPESVPLLRAQAELYLRHGGGQRAVAAWKRLSGLQPGDPGAALNLGFCLEQAHALEDAIASYRRALELRADFLEAHVDLAGILWRVGDFEGSMRHARRAVELAPGHPYAVRILGTAHMNLNQVEDAERCLRRALEIQPGFALAEIDLAFTLLLAGKLEEGWAMYARRWRDTQRMKRPNFYSEEREWKGPAAQPLAGRRIAVYAEQGLGDVIQFIRYVTPLKQAGAAVCCVVQPELVPLVEHSFEGVPCLVPGRTLQADYHVALMDLPMHAGTTPSTVPASVPYLRVPAARVREWAQRMPAANGRLRVGFAWSGSPAQVNNRNRSMRLSDLQPLLSLEGLQCFSLQKARNAMFDDLEPAATPLVDLTGQWSDFTDSAATIENLDLVITVDTAVAHLAGALGKEVWVLLAPNADWRYLLDRSDSPWYPTMRLFRRSFDESRSNQVSRVLDALRMKLAKT